MEITNRNTESKPVKDVDGYTVDADLLETAVDDNARESARLRQELEVELNARLRLAAEYQNYRRRTEREKATAADEGKRELLLQLVSVIDDVDRALDRLGEAPDTVAEGVKMIQRRLHELLETNGVSAFPSKDEPFDPERHEAFDIVAAGEREAGTVHEELRRGYSWNDRLLRPALVVVRQ